MAEILKIAIMALGGQGGGVLSGWLTELAGDHGWHVQTTSVAGVAQRTGATIYYTELAPGDGPLPVMALAPAKGDVDILIAAEAMEAGRAVMRGFVTPDRTTLIASTHRAFATGEKTVPGDGRADAPAVADATRIAAKRLIAFDMEAIAQAHGSMISATLFGALAGSRAMPFEIAAFERVIERGGRGVAASLAAFRAACAAVDAPPAPGMAASAEPAMQGPREMLTAWDELQARIAAMPEAVREMALAGLRKVVDFQDLDYGREYLAMLDRVLAVDQAADGHELSRLAAKYLAHAMAYDDVIRVADRKTRASRFKRIATEMGQDELAVTEYLHPGAGEVCGLLPRRWGERVAGDARWFGRLDRLVNRGRHVRSDGIIGFATLYAVAGLRRWRRELYRHAIEQAHWQAWLEQALAAAPRDYGLACQILECRRLIKGYADTHARGRGKYDRVLGALPALTGRHDAADWLRRLRMAALADPDGEALDGALRTLASLGQASASLDQAGDGRRVMSA